MKSHKNFQLFVNAVNLLPGSWSVSLVGPGLNPRLIETRHKVFNYWKISDKALAEIYLRSAILVNTSSFEGFGMSFLEGGYLGCRIVHLGVLPTVEEILGKTTFHTHGSQTARELSELIVEVSKLDCEHEVQPHLAELYSWDASGDRLQRLLDIS